MAIDLEKLQRRSEEDIYEHFIDYLKRTVNGQIYKRSGSHVFDLMVTEVLDDFLSKEGVVGHNEQITAHSQLSGRFLSVCWELCLRGILRPSVANLNWEKAIESVTGNGYSITEQGRVWLKGSEQNFLLIASKSFANLLSNFSDLYGLAFKERARDAVVAYDAGAYLACCAMCGAACESIYLSLAIAKNGNAEEILKKYRASDGRKQLRNLLESKLSGGLIRSLESGFNILAYWRDMTAHGESTNVGQSEAKAALNTLLGLAQLGSERWKDITQTKVVV